MTNFTKAQILTTIKHLAGGKDADLVAEIMRTSRANVIEIARVHGYPDAEKLAWAADILGKKLEEDAQPEERPMAGGGTVLTQQPGTTPIKPTTIPPVTRPDEIRVLIATARNHESKRIQAAAARIDDAISKLRQLIVEDEKKHHEKRKAAAAKAHAKAEVERLEAELAAAKAKLRGPAKKSAAPAAKAPGPDQGPTAADIRTWAHENGVTCPPTGRIPATIRATYDAHHQDVA